MYAVMRFAKLKTMGQVGALGKHNERERETRNADEARRSDNVRLAGSGDWCADVQARLDTVPLVRTNAVLALEYVLTASRQFFADGDPARLAAWTERSMDWIRSVYGQQNVVAAVLHRDEMTPHLQVVVTPTPVPLPRCASCRPAMLTLWKTWACSGACRAVRPTTRP